MIKDENLIESITQYAKNNKNSSPTKQQQNTNKNNVNIAPDPFARPVKDISNEEIKTNELEGDGN